MSLTIHGKSPWKLIKREIDIVLESGVSQARLLGSYESWAHPWTRYRQVVGNMGISFPNEVLKLEIDQHEMSLLEMHHSAYFYPTDSFYYHMTLTHLDCVSCLTIMLSLYQKAILSESSLCPGTSHAQNGLCTWLSPQPAAQSPMPSPCLDQSVLRKENRQPFLLFSHINDASALLIC